MNKEEQYKEFLNNILSQNNISKTPEPFQPQKKVQELKNDFIPTSGINNALKVNENVMNSFLNERSEYEEIYLDDLPLSFMYPPNTRIYLRSCKVKDIQDFSTYDKTNPFDFRNKLNDIIEKNIIYQNPDGTLNPFIKLMDGDRMWLIYNIREKTFPKGKILSAKISYKNEKNEIEYDSIDIKRETIDIWKNEDIMEYFLKDERVFSFDTYLREEPFIISPPTIGLKNCFDEYFIAKYKKLDKKSAPFFKIGLYLKPNVHYMTYEEIEEFQFWFENEITPDEYSFLLDLINNQLKIGIRGLKKNRGNYTIRTSTIYPDNISDFFIVSNGFKAFIKK